MTEPSQLTASRYWALATLVMVIVGIVAVAFRGSWGAARDAALACHFDSTSADLYPLAVDGLMVVAIMALVLLRHDRGARRYCLSIIGSYTVASWYINFLHGLGRFSVDPATGARPVPPRPVVLVVASLVIGSIFLGSHLLVHVWRYYFPDTAATPVPVPVGHDVPPAGDADTADPEPPDAPVDSLEAAKLAYRRSLAPMMQRLSQATLVEQFRITRREAARVQHEVREELAAELAASGGPDEADEPPQHTPNGHVPAAVGSGS